MVYLYFKINNMRENLKQLLKVLWEEVDLYQKVDFDTFVNIYVEWRYSKSTVLKSYFEEWLMKHNK